MKKLLVLLIILMFCGCALFTPNQAESAKYQGQGTEKAIVEKTQPVPLARDITAEGDVTITPPAPQAEATAKTEEGSKEGLTLWKKISNPWTLAAIALGILSLFLVCVYIAGKLKLSGWFDGAGVIINAVKTHLGSNPDLSVQQLLNQIEKIFATKK